MNVANPPAGLTLLDNPGLLWEKLVTTSATALKIGALHPIPTEYEIIEQNGIAFLVRIVTNLERKEKASRPQPGKSKPTNPFLPYEQDLFVIDISPTHVGLLNKYNVVEHHLLLITRQFVEQETWLDEADFIALAATLNEIDGFGFYNSGQRAGASQPHKHLQVVPLPLTPREEKIPIAPAIEKAEYEGEIGTSPILPYQHAIARIEPEATQLQTRYHQLLAKIAHCGHPDRDEVPQRAYNLLVTREWMMLVPRTWGKYQDAIAVNSLGFAGALLVRNPEALEGLKQQQPLTILTQVGIPRG